MSSHRRLRSRQRTRARIAHLDCNSVPDVISFQLFLRYGSVMVWSAFWRVAVVRWDQTLLSFPVCRPVGETSNTRFCADGNLPLGARLLTLVCSMFSAAGPPCSLLAAFSR